MSYSLYINKNTNPVTAFQNVSDFIVGISEIPYVLRNEDYTIVEDSINIQQSYSYTTYQFEKGDDVLIYSGNVVIYSGVIKEKTSDIENKLFNYEVQPKLVDALSKIKYSYDNMNNIITGYQEYKNLYNTTYSWFNPNKYFIKATNLINAIFDKAEYNLNWTYYSTESFNNCYIYSQSVEYDENMYYTLVVYKGMVTSSVSNDTVYFYVPQLYGVNQDLIWNPEQISNDPEKIGKIPTLYDMLSAVSSMFGLVFIPSSSNGWYVSNVRTAVTKSNNDLEQYLTKKIDKIENGLTLSYRNYVYDAYPYLKWGVDDIKLQPFVYPYDSGLENNMQYINTQIGTDELEVQWMRHLLPVSIHSGSWLKDFGTGYDSGSVLDVLVPVINQPETFLRNKFVMYLGTNYSEEFEIPIAVDQRTTVSEHYINLENDRAPYSKIKYNYMIYEGL